MVLATLQQNLTPALPFTLYEIDLRWTYENLLPSISQQTHSLRKIDGVSLL